MAVGPHEREVGHVLGLERDLAAHQVVEGDGGVGHPEAQHRLAALGDVGVHLVVGEFAAVAVVAGRPPGCTGAWLRASSSSVEQ